jgi:S1-C subfamily serine protease
MPQRALPFLAILACITCGSLSAQTVGQPSGQPLGPLRPEGSAPQSSPVLDRYVLEGVKLGRVARARLASTLAGVDQPQPELRLRGAKEIELYRTLSPSVALIVSEQGLGSASLIAAPAAMGGAARSGLLLTNAHVVGDAREVDVVFKPQQEGGKIKPADAVVGRVRKVDPVRDLALIEVDNVPANAVLMPRGAMKDVQIGADVHAIGHPTGATWTYTKGLVSQIRDGYEWQPDPAGPRHIAQVIQTQTPINPGNSGGPLIDDGGRMIGVNSFKTEGEGLNFAVSIGEVEKFLAAAEGGAYEPKVAAVASKPCDIKVTYEGRSKTDDGFIRSVDLDCGGSANAVLLVPDDKSLPIVFRIDANRDGKVDGEIYDENRDGKWDVSLWDTDFDGTPDLVGLHPDGQLKPSRYERYKPKN